MGCKSCERDAIAIYKDIQESTGVDYFYYHNDNKNQIILSEFAVKTLKDQGKLHNVELTPI